MFQGDVPIMPVRSNLYSQIKHFIILSVPQGTSKPLLYISIQNNAALRAAIEPDNGITVGVQKQKGNSPIMGRGKIASIIILQYENSYF